MPPTLNDSSTLPSSPENPARVSESPATGAEVSSAQPVALEVPVTVNGARAVEGSEKREPFSESTSTVLVLANGAVIRLSSSVAPGQLLFLTNEKTRKEVVCQVVKSKNYRSASGYVELEFTEPVLGFWGMRFPGDRSTAGGNAAVARKSDPVAAAELLKSTEPKATSYAAPKQPAENVTSNLADAVEEFKTDIKTDSRPTSKADFLAPTETSIDGLKPEANRLQEQLSALLFAEQEQGETTPFVSAVTPSKQELGHAAAKILEMADDKAPAAKLPAPAAKADLNSAQTAPKDIQATARSSFESEEVKIPAWLEPLARNASVHAPPAEAASESANDSDDCKALAAPDSASSQKPSAATTAKEPIRAPKRKPSAAVFGNSLLGDTTPELSKPRGSGKGIGLAIAAGLILAAAGGAWYFRESLGLAGAASNVSQSNSSASTIAPVSPADLALKSGQASAVVTNPSSGNVLTETPAPISSPTQGKLQAAAITERIPKSNSNNEAIKAPEKSVEVVEPETKKLSLGNVRLAKPKIARSASVQPNGETEPTLELNTDGVSVGDSSLGANFAESTKQPAAPAAPVAVGGDVKPARMISSVPPIYPALAKAQHVAGEVRVDALVDANGRVTTMKVVSGPSLLHRAAMDALRQWRYQAATLDGKPVAMHLTVTIQFRLQ
jgi:TonB family protein